jgi:hypothetical protein
MAHYRAYFMRGDHIAAAEDVDAEDDAAALLAADQLLTGSRFASIEIWQEKRLVGRLSMNVACSDTGEPASAASASSSDS